MEYHPLVTALGDRILKNKTPIHAADFARMKSDLNHLKTAPDEASLTESVTPLQHPVLYGAPPLTLTPNRLANGMPTVPDVGKEQKQCGISAAFSHSSKSPLWNSQGRLATATKSSIKGRYPKVFQSRRLLKENLTRHMPADDKQGHVNMVNAFLTLMLAT